MIRKDDFTIVTSPLDTLVIFFACISLISLTPIAKDIYGNENEFTPLSFFVDDKIVIEASLDDQEYAPGDEMLVTGKVTTNIPFTLNDPEATITFNNKQLQL